MTAFLISTSVSMLIRWTNESDMVEIAGLWQSFSLPGYQAAEWRNVISG
jgi:hypothetical protein